MYACINLFQLFFNLKHTNSCSKEHSVILQFSNNNLDLLVINWKYKVCQITVMRIRPQAKSKKNLFNLHKKGVLNVNVYYDHNIHVPERLQLWHNVFSPLPMASKKLLSKINFTQKFKRGNWIIISLSVQCMTHVHTADNAW